MSPIRVLIVDDSIFMRTILQDLLQKDDRIEVIGTASNGIEALKKVDEHSPDVMTLDIEMPRMNGLEVLQRLKENPPSPKVLMLSSLTSNDAVMTHQALQLGADDFMLKPRQITSVREIHQELIAKILNLMLLGVPHRQISQRRDLARCTVMIGASAGGPPMLDLLLSSLNPGLDAAVLVIQHMPIGFTAPLAERLNKISMLPVKESENGDLLERGSVLVSKAGYHSVVARAMDGNGATGGRIVHSTEPPLHSVRPAVDKTFTSGAKTFGQRAVGVLLSGMGKDGGAGAQAIKASGGTTIVCAEEDCLVFGMARSAMERGSVDFVIPFRQMHREIDQVVARVVG